MLLNPKVQRGNRAIRFRQVCWEIRHYSSKKKPLSSLG